MCFYKRETIMGIKFNGNIADVNNYKKCKKKNYTIYFCLPPIGTICVNKLEEAYAFQEFETNGIPTFITPHTMLQKLSNEQRSIVLRYAQLGYLYKIENENTAVLYGTRGEFCIIATDKLSVKYTMSDGKPVCVNKVRRNTWYAINPVPDNSSAFACFVPNKYTGLITTSWAVLTYNDPLVYHGNGDFLIAADMNGQPNLNDVYVVNGAVFKDTYDNRGWSEELNFSEDSYNSQLFATRMPRL